MERGRPWPRCLRCPRRCRRCRPTPSVQIQVAPVSCAGIVSVTSASTASDGPSLVTTIVYVVAWSGATVVAPSVFVIDRSASGSEAVRVGGRAVGVVRVGDTRRAGRRLRCSPPSPLQRSRPLRRGRRWPTPPSSRSTVVEMSPVPDGIGAGGAGSRRADPRGPGEDRRAVLSVTGAAVTAEGPALLTTIV